MLLRIIKKLLLIAILILSSTTLKAQDFSIKAERLVFNKNTNTFSADGNVEISIADVTVRTKSITFNN